MELVQAGVVPITGELNLELHLVSSNGDAADLARSADSWSAPGTIRPPTRELSVLDYLASDLAKDILFHLARRPSLCYVWKPRRCQANRRGQYSPSSGGPRERRRRREGRAARIPLHALVPREVPPIPLHISHVLIEVQEERQKFFMRLVTVHQARSDHPRIIEFHGVDVAGEDVPPVLVANGHPCGPLTLHADGDLRGDGGTGEVEDRRRRERGTLGPEGPRALRDHCVSRPASVPAARALGYWRQVTPLATW